MSSSGFLFHVHKAEGEVILQLGDSKTKPYLREVRGMGRREVKKTLEIAAKRKPELVSAWRKIHGTRKNE